MQRSLHTRSLRHLQLILLACSYVGDSDGEDRKAGRVQFPPPLPLDEATGATTSADQPHTPHEQVMGPPEMPPSPQPKRPAEPPTK